MIPRTKTGDCSNCEATNTSVVKIGKNLFCNSCNRALKIEAQIIKAQNKDSNDELDKWFLDRHEEMQGWCRNCGAPSEKNKSSYKCSIAHILPKAYFPSIATNIHNYIELCFYSNSCHTNLDNSIIAIEDLLCFPEIVEKFIAMYPNIAEAEKKRIPPSLMAAAKINY